MKTVTIQFAPTLAPQAELVERVRAATAALTRAGLVKEAAIEPVFPDDEDDQYKGTIAVDFSGRVAAVVDAFRALSGVAEVNFPAERKLFG